jgi:prepilin-type N-terminal cleavage/methylation domain-containing protein
MKFVSVGTQAASPSKRDKRGDQRSGFTLIEALVALSLIVTFAAVATPLAFQARHVLLHGDGQVRAQLLLRALIDEPFDRTSPPQEGASDGTAGDLTWRIDIEHVDDFPVVSVAPTEASQTTQPPIKWALYRVTARVSWGAGRVVKAETLRLGRVG